MFVSLQHQPARIIDIDFIKPKREKNSSNLKNQDTEPGMKPTIVGPTITEEQSFLSTLKVLAPKAAVISASYENETSCDIPPPSLPPTVISLFKPRYRDLQADQLHTECVRVFNEELSVTPAESHFLFKSTHLQSQSSLWFLHRKGRLTASSFGAICKTSLVNPSKTIVKTF